MSTPKTPSEGLYALLTAGVASTDAAGRVYPRADVPQNQARPYVIYFRVSGSRESRVGGGSANHGAGRYQVACYADHQIDADVIIAAIMANCRTHKASDPIRAVDVESGPYDLPQAIEGAESLMAVVAVDLSITYREH